MNAGAFLVTQALLSHHLRDLYEGLEKGSLDIARFSLQDIQEILDEAGPQMRTELLDRFEAAINVANRAVDFAEMGIRWGW